MTGLASGLNRSVTSWFVKVSAFKEDMIAANRDTRWVPAHMRDGRFGKWLEARAKGEAGAALKQLLQLQADHAVLLDNGQEREVAASEVQPGDPGAQVLL